MTDVSRLPPHIAELFAPRPPLKYLPPSDIEPGQRATPIISGVSQYVEMLNTPDPEYTPTESWFQKQQRLKREKAARNAQLLTERTQAWDPHLDKQIRGNTYRTLFVARLSYDVVESDLEKEFSRYGPIERIRVVREKDSDKSRGYAFIEFERERDLKAAYNGADGLVIKGRKILVDVERGRVVKLWKPAKLGGGLGGRHYTKPKPLPRSTRSEEFGGPGSSDRGGGFRSSSSSGRGGFRGGAPRRGGSDRYSSGNSGSGSRFDGGDRRSSEYGNSGPRKDNYRDRRDFKSGSDDRRDKGRRDYRDRSPGRRY